MDEKKARELVPVVDSRAELPPILVGRHTPAVEAQVGSFYGSVAEIFERWVTRRTSKHTQRAYRQDVMDFVQFLGLRWPEESTRLFTVSIAEVLAFRDRMLAEPRPPRPSTAGSPRCPPSTSISRVSRPSFACPSRYRTRPTPSSSLAGRRTPATRPRPSRRLVPGS
jgi:hypothetical protein